MKCPTTQMISWFNVKGVKTGTHVTEYFPLHISISLFLFARKPTSKLAFCTRKFRLNSKLREKDVSY